MDSLDKKLNEVYAGRVVRKELLHQIKKGTNVPSFVLEFLLAKYCASDDPDEVQAGKEAVLETLQKNYVRPDESNKAQSMVQQKGKHKFIDKVHVTYKEKERRHWAEMENFNSQRIAIPEKFYRDNDRLLEGGIWAEATICHNDVDEDKYAFYVEDLKPIQLSRFNMEEFTEGRKSFTRDEWLDVLIRSIGLEPLKMSKRLKFHYLARIFCFVESNYNFIELGPRSTGKSYVYSEFSPFSTLVSGGQASTPTLFYNNQRRKVGLVGFWDTVAFDEVAGIRIKDQNTIDILKDYMANGRFSRGTTVIANASLAFVGNIDYSIEQLVNSTQFDLFVSLPECFDLAVMDRFHCFLPGWEIPKNNSDQLTLNYGFITDYLAEAFHHLARENRFEYVNRNCKFGSAIKGRDEVAVKKTVCAMIKLLHPSGEPTREELEEYMVYAVEGRRRVKEQMNKRKPDDEFAAINLTFFKETGEEVLVYCPESKGAEATQNPIRKKLPESFETKSQRRTTSKIVSPPQQTLPVAKEGPEEKHFKIFYGETGYTYERIFGEYLKGVKTITIEDPYIRAIHQIQNLVRFCELVVKIGDTNQIDLITGSEDEFQKAEANDKFSMIEASLKENGITLRCTFSDTIHDRQVRLDNGWVVKIGRGFDIYQKPDNWFSIGSTDLELRPCLETTVDIYQIE